MNTQQIKQYLIRSQSIIALLLMCIVLSFLSDSFLSSENAWNVMRQISVNVIISVGMTLVILTGGIDLSVGSLLAFSRESADFASAGRHYSGNRIKLFR